MTGRGGKKLIGIYELADLFCLALRGRRKEKITETFWWFSISGDKWNRTSCLELAAPDQRVPRKRDLSSEKQLQQIWLFIKSREMWEKRIGKQQLNGQNKLEDFAQQLSGMQQMIKSEGD